MDLLPAQYVYLLPLFGALEVYTPGHIILRFGMSKNCAFPLVSGRKSSLKEKVGIENSLDTPNAGRSILGESARKQGLEIDPHKSIHAPKQSPFVLPRVCVPQFENRCSKGARTIEMLTLSGG